MKINRSDLGSDPDPDANTDADADASVDTWRCPCIALPAARFFSAGGTGVRDRGAPVDWPTRGKADTAGRRA